MNKKKSPKEIIEKEASNNKNREYAFVKFPRKELIPVTKKSEENEAEMEEERIEELEKIYGEKRNRLHTHPYEPEKTMHIKGKEKPNQRVSPDIPLPSDQDLGGFLDDPGAKSSYIAQYNTKTGKVEGYFVIRKTSKTPTSGISHLEKYATERSKDDKGSILKMLYHLGRSAFAIFRTNKRVNRYGEEITEGMVKDDPEAVVSALDRISHKYHLNYRFVPAKGYKVSKYRTHFSKESEEEGGLEGKVAAVIITLGLVTGLFFISTKITGSAIFNLSTQRTSFLGIGLLILSLIAGFFWLRSRKY